MIKLHAQRGVLEIVVDDPERGNVVDLARVTDFEAALEGVDRTIDCVLLRAEGRNFGLRGDVTTFVGHDPAAAVGALVEDVHGVFAVLVGLDVPVVVAVQGWAAGVAFSLVFSADIVIASDSARLKAAYTQIGLTPDGGMSWTLPRRAPPRVGARSAAHRSLPRQRRSVGVRHRLQREQRRGVGREFAHGGGQDRLWAPDVTARVEAAGSRPCGAGVRRAIAARGSAITAASVSPDGLEGDRAFVERRSLSYAHAGAQTNATTEQH